MRLIHLLLDDTPPFTKSVDFDPDKHVNLFIGPNACGKSTVLRSIKALWTQNVEWIHPEDIGGEEGKFRCDLHGFSRFSGDIYVQISDDWMEDDFGSASEVFGKMPLSYMPATRVNLPARDTSRGDGTGDALKSLFDTDSVIFYGQYVQGAIDQLRERSTYNETLQVQLRKALVVGYSCAKKICGEVIRADVPSVYSDVSDGGRAVHYGMGIVTNDNIDDILGEPALYAGVLSSGTQGTLLWIYALALKIAHHYDWQEGWEKKPAILLIDEIENHLHPTWQRRVIPALLEHFPGLQIFATTHSPFVVAGLKAGQVHLLSRDENGVVTASTNEQDIIGWTMDEILRTMMGVDEPTDEETAKAARELRELRNGVPALTEAEEEKRQERIRELRQKVDRDLLAGGPMAARREEFEKNLAEILERHRREQSLNQENG